MIEIVGLTKQYKDKIAVDKLKLSINNGEIFALLGVNGAGKTTTIKMLSCLTQPSDGDAVLNGHSIITDSIGVKEIISVSPQETAVANQLTVFENLAMMYGVYGHSFKDSNKRANEMIEEFGLGEIRDSFARNLSGGWKRRLSIAMALISSPEILFLDEPTIGLDVLARRELWEIILRLKGKVTVVLTTHYLEEAQALADRIGIMAKGRLCACGKPEDLMLEGETFEDAFVRICNGEAVL